MTSNATTAEQSPPLPESMAQAPPTVGNHPRGRGRSGLHPMHRRPEYGRAEPDAPLFTAEAVEREALELKHRVLGLVRAWPRERYAPGVVSLLPLLDAQRDPRSGRPYPRAHYSAVHRALELLAYDGAITPDLGGWRAA